MPASICDIGRWEARITRARTLMLAHPAASELLAFYADLATFQQSAPLTNRIDDLVSTIPALLSFLSRSAPPRLAEAADRMRDVELAEWQTFVTRYWRAKDHDLPDADEAVIFVVEALLQPFAEAAAEARLRASGFRLQQDDSGMCFPEARSPEPAADFCRKGSCPACSGKPVVGVLREDGQSARRSLVCGLCLTEWPWPRIVCPACGEDAFEALPVYHSEAFPATRLDACDSCRTYLKTIDLSKDPRAVPIVDELASVPLDLWARDQGYRKLRPNLLRL